MKRASGTLGNNKSSKIHVTGVPEREGKECGTEKMFEEIRAEIFLK